ncbi:hypothetical protein [Mobilicoccus pelagius]|uniref:hypothetical protein n=1 Tax=Mobilicoccus pelagius TaxID=746032 RepID=UPI00145E7A55|nr:hypothetical protein [Mobilicoccus pelagius]
MGRPTRAATLLDQGEIVTTAAHRSGFADPFEFSTASRPRGIASGGSADSA